MITETREIYRCDHCRKVYLREQACIDHEPKCSMNPENGRPCMGCMFVQKQEREYYYDTPYGQGSRMVEVLVCTKFGEVMHPPLVEHKGNAYEFGDFINHPMPRTCDHRKFYEQQPVPNTDINPFEK